MSYAAAAGLVVSALGTGYGAMQANKASKERASALKGGTQTFTPQQLDLEGVLGDLLGGNIQNFAQSRQLTGAGNKFNFGEFMRYIQKVQPNFKPLQQQIGSNALSFAQGQLPDDTVNAIGRAASERGIQGGFGFGSQGAKMGALGNLNLRNLGLQSLDLTKYGTNLGLQVNQSAKSLMPQLGSAFDWLLGPQQGLQASMFNTEWQNKAGIANTAAGNALTGNLADSSYASSLNQAAMIQESSNQISKILGQMGQYNVGGNTGARQSGIYNGRTTLA